MHLKKDDLNHLINALSIAEKKSLTLFLNSLPKGENTNYIELFKKLQKKKEFSNLKQFDSLQTQAKAKRRLYDNILKGLRSHHDKKSVDVIIQNILCEIEILYDLSLPEQAMSTLRKAHILANKFEKHGLLLQIFEWERKLNIVLDNASRSNEEIEKEEQSVLEKLNESLLFKNVFSQLKQTKKRYGYIKNLPKQKAEIDRLLANLPKMKSGASQKTHYYHYFIHVFYNWMLFNHYEAYKNSKQLLSEKMEKILPNEFLEGILEHITSCICLAKFEEALSTMDLADQFIEKQKYDQSNNFRIRVFYFKIAYKTLISYYMGEMEQLADAVKETEEQLQRFDKQFSFEMKQVIDSNLKVAYMTIGNIDKTEEIIEETLKAGPKATRKDLYDDALLFNLFILLQTKTYILLPSAALSAQRYHKQFKDLGTEQFDTAYKITSLLQKDYDYENKKIRDEVLNKIKEILQSSISSTTGINNFMESYTYYIIWADSMLNNRPFHEEAADWYFGYCKANLNKES